MSVEVQLRESLLSIHGDNLIAEYCSNEQSVKDVALCCERIALWSNTIRLAEPDNKALAFLAEMQRACHDVAALLALSFYVPAAASMRAVAETALYYSYYRNHPAELVTLATTNDYFMLRGDILEFHKQHTEAYRRLAPKIGFPGPFNIWYGKVSGIVHGQIPGAWGGRLALADTAHDSRILARAIATFTEGVDLIETFLLLTIAIELWGSFQRESKRALLRGMSAERRGLFGLDGR